VRWTNQPPDVDFGYPPSTTPFTFPQAIQQLATYEFRWYNHYMYPFSPAESYLYEGRNATLAEHLGYTAADKILIVNADDLGLTSGINRTISELFSARLVTSTTVMVTAGDYARAAEMARNQPEFSCGVHITMTSSLPETLVGPVSPADQVRSLVDPSGKFHLDRDNFFLGADPAEAESEAIAQIERALADGIDVTHIDSHEGTMQLRPEFADLYLTLAARYRLPLRMGSRALLEQIGLGDGWIERARRLRLQFTDNFIYLPIDGFASFSEKMHYMSRLLRCLPSGVTELYFHPADPRYEPRIGQADRPDCTLWSVREWDYRILVAPEFQGIIEEQGIKLISFKRLRELMRRA
jgi:chitin disaccharide deacetylase